MEMDTLGGREMEHNTRTLSWNCIISGEPVSVKSTIQLHSNLSPCSERNFLRQAASSVAYLTRVCT